MAALKVRKNGSLVLTVRLTLLPGRDDDLIALVQDVPHGDLARQIRVAMRNGVTTWVSETINESEIPLDMSNLGLDL